jgi:hypothetical protein
MIVMVVGDSDLDVMLVQSRHLGSPEVTGQKRLKSESGEVRLGYSHHKLIVCSAARTRLLPRLRN